MTRENKLEEYRF